MGYTQIAWEVGLNLCGLDQGFLVEILDAILVPYPGQNGVLLLGDDDPFPDPTVGVHDEVGNEVCWSIPLVCTMKGGT